MSIEGEIFSVEPDAFAYGGDSVATLPDGKRCFIRGGAPGDRLRIRIVSDRKKFSIGEIMEIEQPSPDRIQPECPLFGQCPACVYSHVSYRTELDWKQRQFVRFLTKAGGQEKAIKPPAAAPNRIGWRTKLRLTRARDGMTGYLGWDNVSIVPLTDCLLAEKPLRDLIRDTGRFPGVLQKNGRKTLTFRYTEKDGALYVSNPKRLLTWEVPRHGCFRVPAGSFCQINTAAAANLFDAFCSALKEKTCRRFIELYCGSGIFSILAKEAGVQESFGVELDPAAVETARLNAADRGLSNCRFESGDAETIYRKNNETADVLLVDPPRTGLDRNLSKLLAEKPPKRLFYISCGPDTLARDLTILTGQGRLKVRSSRMFDLFPSTAHFESFTELSGE